MNILTILKSKAGKFVLGLPQKVALVGGLGAAAAGVMFVTSNPTADPSQEARVRGTVMSDYGRRVGDNSGMQDTIRISGGEGITSASGSSAAAGYDWAADDASLAAVDNLGAGSAGGKVPATRGMAGRSEGLGGNNDIVVINQKTDANGKALAAAGAAGGARAASALAQRGVMATASGGVSGNMYGGSGSRAGRGNLGGDVNRSGNSLGMTGGSSYQLSGSMPEGSTLLASAKFQDVDSSFGGSRSGRAGRGMNSAEGRSLEQVRKRSAEIAQNAHRSANEAGRAFMASSQNSGGIQLDEGGELSGGEVMSDDFEQATINARNNLDQSTDDLMEQELQRKQDRTRLKRAMVTLVMLTIPAMFAISALMETCRKGVFWAGVAAAAVGVAMGIAISLFMVDAGKYMNKWGGSGLTTACMIVGPTLLALIGISFIKKVGTQLNKFTNWLNKLFGGPVVGATAAVGSISGAGSQVVTTSKGIKGYGNEDGDLTNTNMDGN